jgi:hypothetical protein
MTTERLLVVATALVAVTACGASTHGTGSAERMPGRVPLPLPAIGADSPRDDACVLFPRLPTGWSPRTPLFVCGGSSFYTVGADGRTTPVSSITAGGDLAIAPRVAFEALLAPAPLRAVVGPLLLRVLAADPGRLERWAPANDAWEPIATDLPAGEVIDTLVANADPEGVDVWAITCVRVPRLPPGFSPWDRLGGLCTERSGTLRYARVATGEAPHRFSVVFPLDALSGLVRSALERSTTWPLAPGEGTVEVRYTKLVPARRGSVVLEHYNYGLYSLFLVSAPSTRAEAPVQPIALEPSLLHDPDPPRRGADGLAPPYLPAVFRVGEHVLIEYGRLHEILEDATTRPFRLPPGVRLRRSSYLAADAGDHDELALASSYLPSLLLCRNALCEFAAWPVPSSPKRPSDAYVVRHIEGATWMVIVGTAPSSSAVLIRSPSPTSSSPAP